MSIIAAYDRDALRAGYQSAAPFPFTAIENFLVDEAARAAAASYLPYEHARALGKEFKAVNENKKVQIVDPTRFPPAIMALCGALSSPKFMEDLSYITGIEDLVWDPTFSGGGMHQTARNGWLDVHADFNFNDELQLHRRLNILIYLNPVWEESWGGLLELWDKDVKVRHHSFAPSFNRCVVFTTSSTSFHGVTALECPEGKQRCSFAAYYYTREAPPGWDGTRHSTIFRTRPDEIMKRNVLMPAEAAKRKADASVRSLKKRIKTLIGRD